MASGSTFRNIRSLFADAHPVTKLFLLLFGMLSFFFIVTFLGMLLAIPFFNLSLREINGLITNNLENADPGLIKYIQSIQSIGLFVIPGIVLWYLFFNDAKLFVKKRNSYQSFACVLILLSIISMVPLINALVIWNSNLQLPEGMTEIENMLKKMENDAAILTQKILEGTSIQQYLINLLIIAILPAVGEEFIFRGIIQRILTDWTRNSLAAILIAGVLFSAIHLQFYGFVPRLLLGIYFGYLFYWSKSIWLAIWAHFLNNALAVSLHFLSLKNIRLFPAFFGEESITVANFVTGALLTILLVYFTWFVLRKNRSGST